MRRAIVSATLSFSLFTTSPIDGQTGSSRVTVPSPNAASLGKFGDVPVSLYTGVPDISIPLTTVQGKTLTLPVALRYRASGIRVEDIASWVGLGWTLEAGGVITRTVRGKVDEKQFGYYNTGSAWYDNFNWPSPQSLTILQQLHDGQIDGDPDQFFFSFAGRSGQFVMGPINTAGTKEVRTIPSQKLRIIPYFGTYDINSFEITTEDGTRYTFTAKEGHWDYTTGNVTNDGEYLTSSWYLTQVRSPGGDVITLHYSPYTARHLMGWYRELFTEFWPGPPESPCPPGAFDFTSEYFISPAQRLDSIKGAGNTVRFVAGATLRSDALSPSGTPQEPRLDHITVTTPTGTVLRTYQLTHDYNAGGRLRLVSVAEQDASGASLPPYTLTYDPQGLPARTSFAQDHWGYYNGKSGNTSYIPTVIDRPVAGNDHVHPGADRSPNPAFTRASTLTKLTYPTGGFSEFVYEGNDYGAAAFSSPLLQEEPRSAGTYSTPFEGLHSTTFTIVAPQSSTTLVKVSLSMWVHTQVAGCENGDPIYSCPWGEIVGVGKWYPGTPPYAASPPSYSNTVDLVLGPGTYTLQVSAAGKDVDISVGVNWNDLVVATKKPAGGLRIAELRTADAMGNVSVTKYQYTLQSDPATSSGVVGLEPRYDFQYSSGEYCGFYSRSSQSKIPLGSGSIGEVAYREVNVVHGANGEFGSTRHTFRGITEWLDGFNFSVWPFAMRTSNAWLRGQPNRTSEYDAAGRLQQEVTAAYAIEGLNAPAARRFRAMSIYAYWAGGNVGFYGNAYEVIAGWLFQSGETTTQYDTTGASSVATTKTFAHGNPNHLQLTEVTETNSDGTQRITRMKYPGDYLIGTPSGPEAAALAAMQNVTGTGAHMPGVVIERSVSVKNGATDRIVQAEITTFKEFLAGQFLPYRRYVLDSPSPLP